MRTLLQNAAIVFTKCVTFYKIRRYYKMPHNSASAGKLIEMHTKEWNLTMFIAQNANCSCDIYLLFMKYLRFVMLRIVIQINSRRRVALVKINARFFL